jgi:hypothetical protein
MEHAPAYFLSDNPRNFPVLMLNKILQDIEARLNDLEYVTSKTAKNPEISRAKKMALLFELGVLDFLLQKGISQKEIAYYLHFITNSSEVNVEKDLSSRNQYNSSFKNEEAYEFLVEIFSNRNSTELLRKSEETLTGIKENKQKF